MCRCLWTFSQLQVCGCHEGQSHSGIQHSIQGWWWYYHWESLYAGILRVLVKQIMKCMFQNILAIIIYYHDVKYSSLRGTVELAGDSIYYYCHMTVRNTKLFCTCRNSKKAGGDTSRHLRCFSVTKSLQWSSPTLMQGLVTILDTLHSVCPFSTLYKTPFESLSEMM